MSSYYDSKPLSLVERKKQQWARERDEMASLTAPWGTDIEKSSAGRTRGKYLTNPAYVRRNQNNSERRSSLPPLHNKNQNYDVIEKLEKDMGGETSGYGSDNAPEHLSRWNHQAGYESSSSFRDDRLKWGDRGVGVGKFWAPKEIISDYDKVLTTEAPNWVKRGLQRDGELIVSNTSPAESPEQDYREQERPYTGSTTSQPPRSYIRGQNIHVEPLELAERERRRQMAMEHQEAIRQQLEERERRRREERERRIKEERDEELRIEKEREIEIERRQMELKRIQEKQDRERKRKEALEEALKLAEIEAREKKEKQKLLKQNINENVTEKNTSKDEIVINNDIAESNSDLTCNSSEHNNSNNSTINEDNYDKYNNSNKPNNKENSDTESKVISENKNNLKTENVSPPNSYRSLTPRQQLPTYRDNLAFVMQPSPETLQAMQFAVLMPTMSSNFPQAFPFAVPVPVTLANESIVTQRTENRLLTPTIYRTKQFCNSSTQTEFTDYNRNEALDQRHLNEKFSNMDLNYENRTKRGRTRNEDRNSSREMMEDRPKWGANRPPTRYLKQSEKDPLYQRKKLRQKMRQIQVYREKSNQYSPHSSDESQTASPVGYRRNGYVEKKRTRALWRRNDHHMFSRNISVYQTEIIPLESDKDQIYYKSHVHKCCCQCLSGNSPRSAKATDSQRIIADEPLKCQLPQSINYISNGD